MAAFLREIRALYMQVCNVETHVILLCVVLAVLVVSCERLLGELRRRGEERSSVHVGEVARPTQTLRQGVRAPLRLLPLHVHSTQ